MPSTIGVEVAVAVAVERVEGEFTAAIVIGGFRIEIARPIILTPSDFEFIADAVAVEVVQAVALTVRKASGKVQDVLS